ncbi:hypothetical protein C8Q76DRAFT_716977 [Earliella scabrosa]|nr:hypothetical protein C8Q76DRAFT_716977 [Earliella scabrosa]
MEVDMHQLRKTALKLIAEVVEEDRLEEFTYKTFRAEVEKSLGLDSGVLSTPEYKTVVHNVAKTYIEQVSPASEKEEGEAVPGPAKKRKTTSTATEKATKSKKPRASTTKPSGSSAASRSTKKTKKPARSASVVYSSDQETGPEARPSTRSKVPSAPARQRVESESEASDAAKSVEPPAKRKKTTSPPEEDERPDVPFSSTETRRKGTEMSGQSDAPDDAKSESEMSVLIDEPVPRRRKQRRADEGTSKAEKGAKGRKRKEPAKALSKDEETIKRLKSLVVGCGVRKVWSKEFKDLDTPSDQIRRLRQILSDLGMKGRYSMEQAKAIREKREFAQELEDVKEFAQKMESASRRREKKSSGPEADADALLDSDVDVAVKRRPTARQSIMAFLGDEDESD